MYRCARSFKMKIKFVLGSLLIIFCSSVNAVGENCKTPNGEIGKCIHISDCKSFNQIEDKLTSVTEFFLRLSIQVCRKPKDYIVCCGNIFGFKHLQNTNLVVNLNSTTPIASTATPVSEAELDDICGESGGASKIIGGNLTANDEFPWMVLLQYRNKKTRTLKYQCGGSLINNRYVLTAAHCLVIDSGYELFMVRVGDWNYSSPIDCENNFCNNPIDVEIDEIIPHEKFSIDDNSRYDDIGLIRLKTALNFDDFIKPICLPKSNYKIDLSERLTVAGWGIYDLDTRKSSDVLLKVGVKIVRNCKRQYKKEDVIISKNQICAGGEANMDSCQGDSGGPLMKYMNGKYYVLGLVSFGPENCGTLGHPSIYIKVFNYIDWIKQHIRP